MEMHDIVHAQSLFTSGDEFHCYIVAQYHEYVYKPQEFHEGEFKVCWGKLKGNI